MKRQFPLAALLAVVLSPFAFGNNALSSSNGYVITGEYVRSYLGTPLYTISFFTDPSKIVSNTGTLSQFILNPANDVPYGINIVTHTNLKNYGIESGSLRRTLKKAGIEVDRNWNIVSGDVRQQDIYDYVDTVVGRTGRNHGKIFTSRKPGDVVRLIVEHGKGTISYFPNHSSSTDGISLQTSEPDLIRAIISTYIDTGRSLEEIQDMPAALLGSLLQNARSALRD